MPAVPYNPVQQVAPTEQGLPRPSVSSPVEAFGGAVGKAVENLGGSIERGSTELFNRAVAIQNLQNESEAREADAGYMIKAGDLHANYNSLQGNARVQAFPKYAKDLEELRQTTRSGLSNDMTRKMFDSSSLSTMSRSIFNGAGAAASAAKDYQKGTIKAQMDVDAKTVEENPNDEGLFRQKLKRVDENAKALAGFEGFEANNPVALDTASKLKSELALRRVVAKAANEPYAASQMLDQYKKDGLLFGKDVDTADAKVRAFSHTTGTSTIANKVLEANTSDDGAFKKSATEMQNEAAEQAKAMYPNDPTIATAARAALDHAYNQVDYAKTRDQRARTQTVDDYVLKGVTQVGQLPPSLVAQMKPAELLRFDALARNHQRAERTQTDQAVSDQLTGLYHNEPEKFLDTDIMNVPGLSRQSQGYFSKLQRDASKGFDPRVPRMMSMLRGSRGEDLKAIGVVDSTGKKTDDYDRFTGAMVTARQAWMTDNGGKPPNDKQVLEEIFPEVSRVTAKGTFWDTRRFQESVPSKWQEENRGALTQMLGSEPTEQDFARAYNVKLYQKLFEKPKSQAKVPQ